MIVELICEYLTHNDCFRPKNSLLATAFVKGEDQPVAVFQFAPFKFENKNPTAAPEDGRHASDNFTKNNDATTRANGSADR